MYNNMLTSTYNNKFNEYLLSFSISKLNEPGIKTECSHTRIGSKEHKVYGGSYSIPDDQWSEFMSRYYDHVFINKHKEHLTERQLVDKCPILVDLDFRYKFDVKERQHTCEHIQDLIQMYLEELKSIFVFTGDKTFPIYIFEKPHINRITDKEITKDGIHMYIGIQMNHQLQCILRERVVKKIGTIWSLPIINDWDSVYDEGISKGTTNWQMFGSQKPNNEAYQLTYITNVSIDPSDNEFMTIPQSVKSFDLKANFHLLSARYSNHPCFELQPAMIKMLETQSVDKKKKPVLLIQSNDVIDDDNLSIDQITDADSLQRAVNYMLKSLKANEYYIKELHEYTQILPARFYDPGSHLENRKVAFALKNTDERLFISWVMLRSNASDFEYSSIPDLKSKWDYFGTRPEGITKRSIIYFAKQYVPEKYTEVKRNNIDYYIDETIKTATEYDFANVLYQMFKDKYVCSSIIHKKFYVFKDHRWVLDEGNSLRMAISSDMYSLYQDKVQEYLTELPKYEDGDETFIKIQGKMRALVLMSKNLKMTQQKNNIMREAMELFYDKDFIRRMDSNKYLMCFKNGVVDFKNKLIRPGYPQDYITKSTHISIPELDSLDNPENKEMIDQIHYFMHTLFPNESLNRYMWDHLSSCLIGYKKEHVFNIYRGSGSNGKSILTDLMSQTLGEYKGTVPITLVTEKRNTIGGTSSEVIALKGIRYAVMQEPSKDAVINEGVMKELTGGDPIQARALYCDSEIFEPQFNLVVCTNSLFEIKSNDDGTWRRVKLVDFLSKFVSEGEDHTDDTSHVFLKDKTLKEKLPIWAPIFAAILVKRAFKNEGEVVDCAEVVAASKKYRQNQDTIAGFIHEMIVPCEGQYLGKQSVNSAFKEWFQSCFGSRRMPKTSEVHDALNKKYPKKNKKGQWIDIIIQREDNDDGEEILN